MTRTDYICLIFVAVLIFPVMDFLMDRLTRERERQLIEINYHTQTEE